VYTGFLQQFADRLRIGPLSAQEALGKIASTHPGAAANGSTGVDNKNLFNVLGDNPLRTGSLTHLSGSNSSKETNPRGNSDMGSMLADQLEA
jgi:hypothetical protein